MKMAFCNWACCGEINEVRMSLFLWGKRYSAKLCFVLELEFDANAAFEEIEILGFRHVWKKQLNSVLQFKWKIKQISWRKASLLVNKEDEYSLITFFFFCLAAYAVITSNIQTKVSFIYERTWWQTSTLNIMRKANIIVATNLSTPILGDSLRERAVSWKPFKLSLWGKKWLDKNVPQEFAKTILQFLTFSLGGVFDITL